MDVPKRLLAEQLRTGGILINPQQTLQDGVTGDERLLWGDDHVQDGVASLVRLIVRIE